MLIALVAPEIPDYALQYAQVLAEAHDVVLFIPEKFRKPELENSNRLKIRWTAWPRQRSLKNVPFMFRMAREIGLYQPDVVHCLDSNYLWLNLLAFCLRNIPFIITLHDVFVHPGDDSTARVPRSFVKLLSKQATAIVVHGEGLRRDAIRNFQICPERVFVFPHPPLLRYWNLARQAGFSKTSDHLFRILFFGRIQEYKGLRYLIEAAPLVQHEIPNARFVIAGAGEHLLNYSSLLAKSDCFEIHNRFISEHEAAQMLVDADLIALPYVEASQSGVLLAALPFGTPILATDVGEMGTIVRSARIGFVVQPRDPLALASAVIQAASDPSSTKTFRENIENLMLGDLSLRTLSAQAEQMYEQVLDLTSTRAKSPNAA
ncbi:glycosyltransferase family 4 protein [Bradyrhizobium sp. LB13.1]